MRRIATPLVTAVEINFLTVAQLFGTSHQFWNLFDKVCVNFKAFLVNLVQFLGIFLVNRSLLEKIVGEILLNLEQF